MKALVTATFAEEELNKLKQWAEVKRGGWAITGNRMSSAELAEIVENREVLIVELDEVGEEVFAKNPGLKVVGCCRGNPVNVDIEAANKYGIPVINTPARNAVAVAELTIAFLVNIARNVGPSYANLKQGIWSIDGKIPFTYYKGIELEDRTMGMVGFGAISRELMKRLIGFNLNILVYDPYVDKEEIGKYRAKKVSLPELLRNSHFVSLHAKVTEETKGMIGEQEFNLMRKDAYLINTARATIVDEKAMIKALQEGVIAGAALDVFHEEPLAENSPLLKMDNVFITPHIGGATYEVKKHHARIVLAGIFKILAGEKPYNIFNPEVLE